ncbi:peptide/nickel transport system substrate-binding protein [Amycolatopsis xylanica]|uniref:Peptide/nickel transport system substrate-binding protein n=1 Tax=Amycolatopsis xylanica TaxID=589385 RepID=A0A1H3P8B2_9PSEU|nr:ABC transporter substrate-binding protein [Amycolatopsis xylanica]SDY97301.1 peptide/nickel transport system substrate-binding protein [Amycolatopsis xylanica]
MKPKKIVGVAMAASLLVGGCSAGGQNSGTTDAPKNEVSKVSLDKDGSQSKGPAKEVPGSRKGGTITALWRQDQTHYDPGQMQTSPDQTISELISRRLTMYKIEGDKTTLVGDLATNTGESTDGGKTWKYTLKDGIKHSDGTPIVAADFKWAVERSFYEKYNRGFPYIQTWLADSEEFSKVYNGPYDGKELGNDKIEVPDDKTIIFKLPKPHPDFPFAAALGTTVPVQKAKDSKEGLDANPPTNGPYKIESHVVDKSLKLVKNEFWDPNTDPIRHQFVDGFTINFGPLPPEITDRLTAGAGDDKNATALYHSVPAERIDQVMNDPKLKAQVLDVATSASEVYSINTTRITDVNVRKALLTAFPKEQARQTNGGPFYGDLSTTLGSPANLGWKKYDLPGITDVNPKGDPEKAKKMLTDAGKLGQSISFGYSQQPNREKEALAIADGLEKAGFKVEKIPMQPKTFNDARDTVNNNLDLYWSSWAADWPTGVTVYPEIYDGRKIGDGRPNNSHFNDPEINKEIDRILAIDDPIKQGDEFSKLDAKIMEKVPAIPYAYTRRLIMSGTNVGGASVDTHGVLNFANLFLKS